MLIVIVHQTIAKNNVRDGRRKSFGKVIFWKIIIVLSSAFTFTFFFTFRISNLPSDTISGMYFINTYVCLQVMKEFVRGSSKLLGVHYLLFSDLRGTEGSCLMRLLILEIICISQNSH